MAAAQAYHQQCLVHDQTFNAEQYHLNQAQQTGYVTAEALQFVLGPELLQGAVKAGSRVMGLGVGAKVAEARDVSSFLSNPAKASQFADEIIAINKKTEGSGQLHLGSPLTAVNSALYYEKAADQGAVIFRSIAHGHMFTGGNKRTAIAMWRSFAEANGITCTLTDTQLMNIATKVATGELTAIAEISAALTK